MSAGRTTMEPSRAGRHRRERSMRQARRAAGQRRFLVLAGPAVGGDELDPRMLKGLDRNPSVFINSPKIDEN